MKKIACFLLILIAGCDNVNIQSDRNDKKKELVSVAKSDTDRLNTLTIYRFEINGVSYLVNSHGGITPELKSGQD